MSNRTHMVNIRLNSNEKRKLHTIANVINSSGVLRNKVGVSGAIRYIVNIFSEIINVENNKTDNSPALINKSDAQRYLLDTLKAVIICNDAHVEDIKNSILALEKSYGFQLKHLLNNDGNSGDTMDEFLVTLKVED